jgi:hypothetical protein
VTRIGKLDNARTAPGAWGGPASGVNLTGVGHKCNMCGSRRTLAPGTVTEVVGREGVTVHESRVPGVY